MNLGSDYDYATSTIKISGYKLGEANVVTERLVNAIKNSVEAVNDNSNNINAIRIVHEKSGISLEVKKSHVAPKQQAVNLVSEALEQLKKPASDDKIPEYNLALSNAIKNSLTLDGDNVDIKKRGLLSSRLERVIKRQSMEMNR